MSLKLNHLAATLGLITLFLTIDFEAAVLFAKGSPLEDSPSSAKPNIILFIADDVSWNDYGCYGNSAARTPNIDALAKNGLRFDNAFLTASSCSPSRASIITGRYPHNNGKGAELHLPIASHLPWFPEMLRELGYYTALVGKNHMKRGPVAPNQPKPKKVFDLIDNGQIKGNSGGHGKWVQTFENRPKDKPFFFWFAATDAHRGWDADRQWKKEYGPKADPQKVVVPPFLVDDPKTRGDLASYYNEVTRFDYHIGQVVAALKKEGELDNTLIFVMADNGRPFPRAKTRLHDSGMKTALVAHWPSGISSRGDATKSLVSVIDLAPTILNAAGAEKIGPTLQGVDINPIFSDPKAQIRKYAFSEHNWHDYEAHGRSVRDQDGFLFLINSRPQFPLQGPADSVRSPSHKALQDARDSKRLSKAQKDVFASPRSEFEFFDSYNDRLQLENMAGNKKFAKKEEQLRAILKQWSIETADSVPSRISQDSFDRESGDSLRKKNYRGITPGEDRNASKVNSAGPK